MYIVELLGSTICGWAHRPRGKPQISFPNQSSSVDELCTILYYNMRTTKAGRPNDQPQNGGGARAREEKCVGVSCSRWEGLREKQTDGGGEWGRRRGSLQMEPLSMHTIYLQAQKGCGSQSAQCAANMLD